VIGDEGADRSKIAEIVFGDADQLDWLEELLHPRVVRENFVWRDEIAQRPDPPALTVTEVPLLYETGADKRFDAVVVITAPEQLRRERRPPDEEKLALADFAYVNDRTLEELDAFVAGVVAKLTA
jgi:dephospho-CoA kinase